MPLDPTALGYRSPETAVSWNERDSMLYALSIGAGADELQYTTENTSGVTLVTAPSMAVIYCQPFGDVWERLGDFDWSGLVHAQQSLELIEPLPPAGSGSVVTTITDLQDKGSAAVVAAVSELRLHDGRLIARGECVVFIKGAGGWGGERGASNKPLRPAEAPAVEINAQTMPTQALFYRLNADRNPLHSDPEFARRAGLERPILHGLCTLGIAVLRLVQSPLTPGKALQRFSVRFARPFLPGDALTVALWPQSDGRFAFEARDSAGQTVLDAGSLEFTAS